MALALPAAPVWAQAAMQPQANPAASSTPTFAIRGFNVKGENPLGPGETSKILAPFLRSDATIDVLQKATAALELALRNAGYGLHRVALPPQEVGDTVTLEIVKFTIGRVVVDGNQRFSEANIRASVPELKEGESPNFRTLAIQTAIANENPTKQTTVALKESALPDAIDATVQVKESRPWTLALNWANTGTKATGRDRLTVSGGYYNLWDRDHQFIGAYTTSAERTEDVKQIGLSYRAPVYALSGVLGISYTRSDVLGTFGAFNSTGAGRTLGFNYTYHLPHEGARRRYINVSLDDKLFEASRINGIVIGQDRRSRPLTVAYNVRDEALGGYLNYALEISLNTSSGADNSLGNYRSEYQGITSRGFRILRANAAYSGGFAQNWLWSLRGQTQLSNTALISGEQMGLGGANSVRGTDERALAGDRGLQTNLEITTPELFSGLRLMGFIDAGWLQSRPNGGSRLSSDHLTGVGLGLRYYHPVGVYFTADYGRIVTGSKLPLTLNSGAPKRGDDKLHVNLSVRF